MTDRVSPTLADPITPLPTLRDRVASLLREAIVTGTLAPATRLSEPSLARQLRVSRGPIREAIRELAAEGLVRIEPRIGTFVTQMSSREIDEVFAVKGALEGLAARLAAESGTEETRRALLAPILEQLDTAVAARDAVGYVALTRRFHEAILGLAGNSRLAGIYRTLADQVQHLRGRALSVHRRLAQSCRDHHAIAAAIIDGRSAHAERLVRNHNARTGRRLADAAASPTRERGRR